MTTVPNRHPHPPLADWDATSLIMQATDEGRTVSELLAEILADDAAAKRAARWELAGNLALTVLALIVTYCTVIGAVEILVSLGVSA
ncbi:hypothetical protein [Tomitella biformata]|uniref:hypothetical protein n=1 Tax=Tomitella biformata TaxID=630403 RepID=UPI000463702C|nr:hypothetical protein [Tomitella biformata]